MSIRLRSVGVLLVYLLSGLAFDSSTQAAELRLNISGTYRSLDIEGRIELGDYERFVRLAKESQAQLSGVHLYSTGGDFSEAMKIGRALRALELSSQVPQRGRDNRAVCDDILGSKPRDPLNCTAASAAFFVHIGGMNRGGTYLAVHRPFFDPQRFKSFPQQEAHVAYDRLLSEARVYMNEMAIPQHLQEEVLSTPSDKLVLLDERQIRTHIWGDLPHRHEWRRAQCVKLSSAESQRLDTIGRRLLSRESLNADERGDLSRLQAIQKQELNCEIALIEESRRIAYQKFFGTTPSDAGNHNFSKWLDAPKYLGRTFEDISSEERFEPDPLTFVNSTLVRKETATSPSTSVMDSPNSRKTVSWVAMVKERPSPQFCEKVRSTLEAAWGKPLGEENALVWVAPSFHARLNYDPRGARPALLLVVESPRQPAR